MTALTLLVVDDHPVVRDGIVAWSDPPRTST